LIIYILFVCQAFSRLRCGKKGRCLDLIWTIKFAEAILLRICSSDRHKYKIGSLMRARRSDGETIKKRDPEDVKGDGCPSPKHDLEVWPNRASRYHLSAEPLEKERNLLVLCKGHAATLQAAGETEERVL